MISGSTQPGRMICTTLRGGARTGALLALPLKVLSAAGFRTPLDFLKLFQTSPQVIQSVTSSRGKKNKWCLEEPWLHQVVCSSYLVCLRSSCLPISNVHPPLRFHSCHRDQTLIRAPDIIVNIIIIIKTYHIYTQYGKRPV